MKRGYIYMKTAPCVNCERKGCGSYHDQCPLYLEFKKKKEKEYNKRKEAKDERDWIRKSVDRNKKRRHNKNGR